jgi:hypothetical protein
MTRDQREIHRKKRILECADKIGNINKTCRYFGVARSTFYLWRDRYREFGDEVMLPLSLSIHLPFAQSHDSRPFHHREKPRIQRPFCSIPVERFFVLTLECVSDQPQNGMCKTLNYTQIVAFLGTTIGRFANKLEYLRRSRVFISNFSGSQSGHPRCLVDACSMHTEYGPEPTGQNLAPESGLSAPATALRAFFA